MAEVMRTKIDGFLKVPDIPGAASATATRKRSKSTASNSRWRRRTTRTACRAAVVVSIGMIVFTKYYDMASPYLKKALFENTPLDEVVFSARRTIEGETSDYLVVTLTDASVMNYEMHAARRSPT